MSEAAILLLQSPNSWLPGTMSQFRALALGSDSSTTGNAHTNTHTSPHTPQLFYSHSGQYFLGTYLVQGIDDTVEMCHLIFSTVTGVCHLIFQVKLG